MRMLVALYNRKMNDDGKPQAPLSYEITYQPAGPIWFEACALSADLISRQSIADQLVHHLAAGPKQIVDLQRHTGKDPGAIRRALRGSSRTRPTARNPSSRSCRDRKSLR